MADTFSSQRAVSPTTLGVRITEHTPADSDLPDGVKCVLFNVDGTCDIKNADGAAVTGIPVLKMVPLAFVPARITAMATATKCYLVR